MMVKTDVSTVADFSVVIRQSAWDSPVTVGNRDTSFDAALASSDTEGNWLTTTSGISTDVYYSLDNMNVSYVDTGGITQYSILSGRDIDNLGNGGGNEYLFLYPAEETGTSKDPYLSITLSTISGYAFGGFD